MKIIWLNGTMISSDHDGYCSGEENTDTEEQVLVPLEVPNSLDLDSDCIKTRMYAYDFGTFAGNINYSGSGWCARSPTGQRHSWLIKDLQFNGSVETLDTFPSSWKELLKGCKRSFNLNDFIDFINSE